MDFFQSSLQMYENDLIRYLKINITFFCSPLFFKDFINSQNQ